VCDFTLVATAGPIQSRGTKILERQGSKNTILNGKMVL
jgi:hypothetical protein